SALLLLVPPCRQRRLFPSSLPLVIRWQPVSRKLWLALDITVQVYQYFHTKCMRSVLSFFVKSYPAHGGLRLSATRPIPCLAKSTTLAERRCTRLAFRLPRSKRTM